MPAWRTNGPDAQKNSGKENVSLSPKGTVNGERMRTEPSPSPGQLKASDKEEQLKGGMVDPQYTGRKKRVWSEGTTGWAWFELTP